MLVRGKNPRTLKRQRFEKFRDENQKKHVNNVVRVKLLFYSLLISGGRTDHGNDFAEMHNFVIKPATSNISRHSMRYVICHKQIESFLL